MWLLLANLLNCFCFCFAKTSAPTWQVQIATLFWSMCMLLSFCCKWYFTMLQCWASWCLQHRSTLLIWFLLTKLLICNFGSHLIFFLLSPKKTICVDVTCTCLSLRATGEMVRWAKHRTAGQKQPPQAACVLQDLECWGAWDITCRYLAKDSHQWLLSGERHKN